MVRSLQPKVVVHHLNQSRSQRILWLLEELEVSYEIKFYERDKKTLLAPPSLKAIHPLGKSPVVTIDKLVLAESGAIIEYLIAHFGDGKLRPSADSTSYWKYNYWLHYAEGSAMLPLLLSLIFGEIEKAPVPFFVKPVLQMVSLQVNKAFITPQLKLHFDYIESELSRTPWFAGEVFSAADIQMSFPLEGAEARGALGSAHPHCLAFLEKIHSRPAYKQALERTLERR